MTSAASGLSHLVGLQGDNTGSTMRSRDRVADIRHCTTTDISHSQLVPCHGCRCLLVCLGNGRFFGGMEIVSQTRAIEFYMLAYRNIGRSSLSSGESHTGKPGLVWVRETTSVLFSLDARDVELSLSISLMSIIVRQKRHQMIRESGVSGCKTVST
jgi:hypothetical protein